MSVPIQVTPRQIDPVNSLGLGQSTDALGGHLGELVVSEMFGKYYNLTRAGMVFTAQTPGAIPAFGTSCKLCFWNPSSSRVNMVPLRWSMAYTNSGQTAGVNDSFLFQTLFAGDEIGTTNGPVLSFTALSNGLDTSSVNRYVIPAGLGGNVPGATGGRASKIRVGSAATLNGTGALVATHLFSISQQVVATTGTSVIGPLFEDFDGTLIYGPGTFTVIFADVASGDLWRQQLIWAEVPI